MALMTRVPQTMNVVEIGQPGPPQALRPAQRPVPAVGRGEVLIKVAAAGVNRPDVMQRQGAYPPPAGVTDIPGLEVAGEIVSVGAEVSSRTVGEQVCALVAGGGYAEYVAAPAAQCLPVPKSLTLEEAATLPETFFTVYLNVFERAALSPGESLLVHGGGSGIGTTAILLGKANGSRVFATAGSARKCEACLALGVDRAINYREEDFVAAVEDVTKGKGVDVILDMVGILRWPQRHGGGRRRPHCPHRAARRRPRRGRSACDSGQATEAHGCNAAAAVDRVEGQARAGVAHEGVAVVRLWPVAPAAHLRTLRAR